MKRRTPNGKEQGKGSAALVWVLVILVTGLFVTGAVPSSGRMPNTARSSSKAPTAAMRRASVTPSSTVSPSRATRRKTSGSLRATAARP